ncbi:hypothetical protein OH76DRAFT_1480724 [Lentinus brumalis]|uniref:DUF6593 domain-containing protein n=1 Tax=Lentinus brumalis TaxID=2498619 RepID=A0A371DJB2_9APHY|nr:hypothetical protein OH76DRAFT_1480724 [Polyporus brumalis]
MNVSFDSVDPLNSAVVDDATGQVLFQVSTPRWKLGNSTTTIKDQNEQVVAEYEPRFGHDMVTVHGRTTQKSEWLPRKSRWSSDRVLTAPDGRTYIWHAKWNNTFQLVPSDSESKDPVVKVHNWGLFSKSGRGRMAVEPEVMPFLDMILLSFIICHREKEEQTAAGAAGGTQAVMAGAGS